jgi:hypothetical protein
MLLIVETPLFTKQIMALATDEEYRALQEVLVANPAVGHLIPSGGGIRKVRMARPGRGKRGGARVIYYWRQDKGTIFMLVAYAKSVKTNLSPAEISTLRELVKALGR